MIRVLLNHLPAWLLALVVFAAAELIVLANVAWRTRHKNRSRLDGPAMSGDAPLARHVERKEGLTLLFSFVTATYGVFLAFVVVSLWTDYQSASSDLNSEASQLAIVARLAEVLPAPDGPRLAQEARDYSTWVRQIDFPLMRQGDQPTPPPALQQMYETLASVRPTTAEQQHFSESAVQALAQLTTDMRSRDWRALESMPYELQLLLFGGAAMVIELATLLDYENGRLELAVTSTIAAVVAFLIFLTISLEYPYSGGISARTDALQQGILAAPDGPTLGQQVSANWGSAPWLRAPKSDGIAG